MLVSLLFLPLASLWFLSFVFGEYKLDVVVVARTDAVGKFVFIFSIVSSDEDDEDDEDEEDDDDDVNEAEIGLDDICID